MGENDLSAAQLAPAALEAVPYVGRLVGTLARAALQPSEEIAIQRCLERALRIDDGGGDKRSLVDRLLWRRSRELRAAKRQATLDLLGDVELMEYVPTAIDPGPTGDGEASNRSSLVPESSAGLTQFVWKTARKELGDALGEETFVPWPSRLASSLTLFAAQRWKTLEAKAPGSEDEREDERVLWARLIMNGRDATPDDVNPANFVAFGQRVGLRFEVSMVRDEALTALVGRLDHADRQRVEASLLTKAQGIRVALMLSAVSFLLVFGAAIGIDELP